MHQAAFHIVVIAVAACGAVRGWRRGLSGMAASVLGFAFGVVCAHVAAPWAEAQAAGLEIISPDDCRFGFVTGIAGRSAVYAAVYIAVKALASAIGKLLKPLGTGLLNSLAGSAFAILDWLMWTSIALNLLLCFRPDCGLERCGGNDDGNIVSETMLLSPALLGGDDICDLWHACRLHDARLISSASKEPMPIVEDKEDTPPHAVRPKDKKLYFRI